MSVPCEELSAQPVLIKNVTKNKQISQKKKKKQQQQQRKPDGLV